MKDSKCCGFVSIIFALIAGISVYLLLINGTLTVTGGSPFFQYSFFLAAFALLGFQLAATLSARNPFRTPSCGFYGKLSFVGAVGTVLCVLADALIAASFGSAFYVFIAAGVFFLILLLVGLGCLLYTCNQGWE